ncbi:PH domain-containing protein [Lactobacillaceae bacterium L1_55_11]|nr:PH domain-containing protein [Lactobacillaceae bacterium L1_55_11]
MHHLPRAIKVIWYEILALESLAWVVLFVAYWWLENNLWSWLPSWGLLIIAGLAALNVIVELILIQYRYAIYQYQVSETDVEIKKGFFFREDISIPIARVQNVDLDQGPLLQLNKLYKVRIATGGSGHTIEALDGNDAQRLKDRVMALALEARNAR